LKAAPTEKDDKTERDFILTVRRLSLSESILATIRA
jgi:hypothetical protein